MKEYIAELEHTLVINLRPHFLKVEPNPDFIHIVLCHPRYTNLSISERVGSIFSLLKSYNNDILEKVTVIVEVYDPEQMDDLFEFWLKE